MDHKNIDKLFNSGLNGYRPKAPPGAWNRLNHDLIGLHRIKALVLIRWAAAAILILMAFGAGYFFATVNNSPPQFTESEATPRQETNTDISTKAIDNDQGEANTNRNDDRFLRNENILSKNNKIDETSEMAQPDIAIINDNSSQTLSSNTALKRDEITIAPVMAMIEFDAVPLAQQEFLMIDKTIINQSDPTIAYDISTSDINLDNYYTPPADSRILKWTIGAQFAPTYSYREISTNYNSGPSGDDISAFNNAEEPLLSYAGGVNVAYAFNKKWSLNSGMYFSRIGQISNDALEFRQEKDEFILTGIFTSSGVIDFVLNEVPENVRKVNPPKDSISDMDPLNVKIIQNFDLFEVPLIVKYHLVNKKLSVNFSGGLSPAFLARNNNYLEFESNRYNIGSAANLNSFILNSTFGLGFGYKLSKKLTINFEPTFKYSLSPINNDSKVYYHPYYLSWFTGINYRF